VWGSHYERGFAQGYLLASNIKNIYEGYIQHLFGAHLYRAVDIVKDESLFKIDSIYHDEARGIVDGISYAAVEIKDFTHYHVLMSNIFLDILGLSQMSALRDMRNLYGCSVLMSWGKSTSDAPELGGQSIVTRHLDWPVHEDVVSNQVIVVHIPEESDEQQWLMIGFAGQISVLSGINEKGYAVFLNMMNNYNEKQIPLPDRPFEPLGFVLRKAIEKKNTDNHKPNSIYDIKAAIKHNAHGYAEGYIVSAIGPVINADDTMPGFIAELAPTYPFITLRTMDDGDGIPGTHLYASNTSVGRKPFEFCMRYNAISHYLHRQHSLNAYNSWHIMRRYSTLENNIQFMQFIPHSGLLRISLYQNNIPAYLNDFYILNTRQLFIKTSLF